MSSLRTDDLTIHSDDMGPTMGFLHHQWMPADQSALRGMPVAAIDWALVRARNKYLMPKFDQEMDAAPFALDPGDGGEVIRDSQGRVYLNGSVVNGTKINSTHTWYGYVILRRERMLAFRSKRSDEQ